MNKTFLPLILVVTLAIPAAFADDGFNFVAGATQAEKPAKAQREKNDGHWLEYQAKLHGAAFVAGAVNGAVLGAAALNPLVAAGTLAVIGVKVIENKNTQVNAFYSGTVIRGKIRAIVEDPSQNSFGGYGWSTLKVAPEKSYGFDLRSFPSNELLAKRFNVLHLDVDGPESTTVFALAPKEMGAQKGDIVDVKYQTGVFTLNTHVYEGLRLDFNKHMPRVVSFYCKRDNQVCQNNSESSLGVISRHTDTEFPPSQYLINPAIIADDQARMRKDEEEKKAASNNGVFNFM